ncbi:hypothetical protein [Schlesneria paludicola]|uniref:hypothetical protein n=1 Tax=Schlesneria paludicola TaxID=360056 RepID=UPI00029A1BCF|nr:hypothetical protein [Schlesneria paludicola]
MARFSGNDDENPFASPKFEPDDVRSDVDVGTVESVQGKVMAPAIAMIMVASLGLLMSFVNIVIAAIGPQVVIDPNAPKILQDFQRGQVGPVAIVFQSVFVVVNSVILFGAVQMLRFRSRIFAVVVSIVSIINFGTCCCLLGAPFGIWSLVVLLSSDVIQAFETAERLRRH